MKFEKPLDQKIKANIMLNILKFFNTSDITIVHIDMIIARDDEFAYNWENNAEQVMKSNARQKIVKLLKITNIFILSKAISAHLTKIVKSSSKSSMQRKESFDEENFDEDDHEKSRSQRKSATTSNFSVRNVLEFNMSLRLVEEKKNAPFTNSSTDSQDTLFVSNSRESEIEIEKRDSESRMTNEIKQLEQSTEKKLTPIESKNEDEKQDDEDETHYDKQTSNVITKTVILKKMIKRNSEKSIDLSIASKTTSFKKSRKRKIHETEKDIVRRLQFTNVSFDYTSTLLNKMSTQDVLQRSKKNSQGQQYFSVDSTEVLKKYSSRKKTRTNDEMSEDVSKNDDNQKFITTVEYLKALKSKRKKLITKDIAVKHSEITRDVSKEDRLSDEQLIELEKQRMTKKNRWMTVSYVWNLKNLLYDDYKYLETLKDENGERLWSNEILKPYVLYESVKLFLERQANSALTEHMSSRQRTSKVLIDKKNSFTEKFVKIKNNLEARQLSEVSRNWLIYDRHLSIEDTKKQKTKIRMKKKRRKIEVLHKNVYRVAVINEKWSKEMNDVFMQTNKNLLATMRQLVEKNLSFRDENLALRDQIRQLQTSLALVYGFDEEDLDDSIIEAQNETQDVDVDPF